MSKRVLMLTSTNLACNPRCLKEVTLLLGMDIHVTLVAFNLHNWTTKKEQEINEELKKVEFHYLEAGRAPLFNWLVGSFIEKAARAIAPIFRFNLFVSAMAVSKRTWSMLKWVERNDRDYDLIIAHNPPAFYPAARLAAKRNIPFALDVEDFHPGEGNNKRDHENMLVVMRKVFARAAYLSYASPLIRKYTEDVVGRDNPASFVINNVFPSTGFRPPEKETAAKLKIVWFSQYIDLGRGLEQLIPCLERFSERLELTLIGNMREPFYQEYVDGKPFIRLEGPMTQQQLLQAISAYDIGLAIEPGRDANNRVALSNKIWTYFQGGLFIFASDTPAQADFIAKYPGCGICVPLKEDDIVLAVDRMIGQIDQLRAGRTSRFEQSGKVNWESESAILLNKWKEILG
jgi:hypothetical protein